MTSGYMTVLFNSIDRMSFLTPTLDNADLLFALMITPGLYQRQIEVVDQDTASGKT